MKLLWVKSDFLHPTTRGGQIRSLEMLRRLHQRHEVHYVAFEDPGQPEGLARSGEYAAHAYPVRHSVPPKRSLAFAGQLVKGLFWPLPVAASRYVSREMLRQVSGLARKIHFDSIVSDFMFPALNMGEVLERAVLFQHNVETMIWRRHQEQARDPLRRFYFRLQAERMFDCEGALCRRARHVVAVSEIDAQRMREMFRLKRVSAVATGVDSGYFRAPKSRPETRFDMVFVGSMDWMPNQDGALYFLKEILPRLRQAAPECTIGIVGRLPPAELTRWGEHAGGVTVTGTVPDVRPYLWGAKISVVPLRIGGGTRLKIYESMAAGTPVVATTIGAEGLDVMDGENIRLADTPEDFASACARLLKDPEQRARLAEAALERVTTRFSWEAVTDRFEQILLEHADR
jgi:glycosyltransferase involved in cell wall biosynthesis